MLAESTPRKGGTVTLIGVAVGAAVAVELLPAAEELVAEELLDAVAPPVPVMLWRTVVYPEWTLRQADRQGAGLLRSNHRLREDGSSIARPKM